MVLTAIRAGTDHSPSWTSDRAITAGPVKDGMQPASCRRLRELADEWQRAFFPGRSATIVKTVALVSFGRGRTDTRLGAMIDGTWPSCEPAPISRSTSLGRGVTPLCDQCHVSKRPTSADTGGQV